MPFQFLRNKYPRYEIGEYTYGEPHIINYNDGGTLKIGKFCGIAYGVTFVIGGNHYYRQMCQYPLRFMMHDVRMQDSFSKGDLIIENDVWIGVGALVLDGLTIGNGATIGAATVVAKSVEPYSIVIGNPARVIGKRFDDKTIEILQEIQWWNWSVEKIKKYTKAIVSTNIDELVEVYLNN